MKNTILITAMALLISQPAFSKSELSAKVGFYPGKTDSKNAGKAGNLTMTIEPSSCSKKNHCVSASVVNIDTVGNKNVGGGIDYVFRPLGSTSGTFKFEIGVIGFEKPLNFSERFNFHLSAGVELYTSNDTSLLLSVDHYSNGRTTFNRDEITNNVPVNFITIGLKFR